MRALPPLRLHLPSTVPPTPRDRMGVVKSVARSYLAIAIVVACGAGLVVGGLLRAGGADGAASNAWAAVGAVGAVYALWEMLASLRRKRLGVDVIAFMALVGALIVGEQLAAGVIALMLATGRALEGWAAGRANRDLQGLIERAPKLAHRYRGGVLETVPAESVVEGDLLMVATGEILPVDGVLLSFGFLDESALTGEPLPLERHQGEAVRSGAVNVGQVLDMRATGPASAGTYAGIVRLVREAQASQAPLVRLADRFALWFLAFTVTTASVVWAFGGAGRAVAVLVVATPCPLILAAPVAVVAGLSRSARRGVVIKGGAALERLAECKTLLVDKTGTLTAGRPKLSHVASAPEFGPDDVLCAAASLEQASSHVLAGAVREAARARNCRLVLPEDVEEIAGKGVKGSVDGHNVAVGNHEWAGVEVLPGWAEHVSQRAALDGSLAVFVAVDHSPAGVLVFDDPLRKDAARTVRQLRRSGVERIVVISGDRDAPVQAVRSAIGADEAYSECTPASKLEIVRREGGRARTIMVGDGINDAPALALADIGVAIAARGASASSEAADIVLVADHLGPLGEARAIAAKSRRIALESAVAGISMSVAAMGAAAAGVLPALWGAILQEGIDVAVILNALRALRPSRSELHLSREDLALTARFQREHEAIRANIEAIGAAATALDSLSGRSALRRLKEVHKLLVDQIQPHEEAEESVLYPALDRILGGHDATAPMSLAHTEILRQIHRLGLLLDAIGPNGPDAGELAELRDMLSGLHAVLELHTAQEDHSYLSLDEVSAGEVHAP